MKAVTKSIRLGAMFSAVGISILAFSSSVLSQAEKQISKCNAPPRLRSHTCRFPDIPLAQYCPKTDAGCSSQ